LAAPDRCTRRLGTGEAAASRSPPRPERGVRSLRLTGLCRKSIRYGSCHGCGQPDRACRNQESLTSASSTRLVSWLNRPSVPRSSMPFSRACATSCSTTLCSSMPAAAGACYWICCHVVDRVSHGLTPFRISDQAVPSLSRQSPGVGTVLVVWSDCSRKEDRVYRASYR
jgi:hypothetical protein